MGGMTNDPCPVCGHKDGACTGNTRTNERMIISSNGTHVETGPPRVPMNQGRIGKSGYVGPVVTYDPKRPNIRFVAEEVEGIIEEADDEPGEGEQIGDSGLEPVKAKKPRADKRKKAAEDKSDG